jgi:2'-5' RNA ligase
MMGPRIVVASRLEEALGEEVWRWWRLFESKYGSRQVRTLPHPHITFQGGRCGDLAGVERSLSDWVLALLPFEVVIKGLGYFEGASPVVYLRVVNTEVLATVNREVNRILACHCDSMADECAPENWIPHVTLAMGDLDMEAFQRARRDLLGCHPEYQQMVGNICLVRLEEGAGRARITRRWCLSESS